MSTENKVPRYLSVQDIAADIGVSDQLIWKLIRQNKLPAKFVRIGASIRIEKASWEAFLNSGGNLTPVKPGRGRRPKAVPLLDMQRIRELSHAPA